MLRLDEILCGHKNEIELCLVFCNGFILTSHGYGIIGLRNHKLATWQYDVIEMCIS